MTGHSHQAWPNVSKLALAESFEDAALQIDDKWESVFKKCAFVQSHIAGLIGCQANEIALAPNTHELFTRFLSALPLKHKPVIVATDGEFHSIYRQLKALVSANLIQVRWVKASPSAQLAERLIDQIDEQVSAVVCSAVMFQDAAIVHNLDQVHLVAQKYQAKLFIDAYHAFKIVPLHLSQFQNQADLFISAGGYKYAQWGEGACWMRVPEHDQLRPIYTGWFSDFDHLDAPRLLDSSVQYGQSGQLRFAGSTFDPTSWYRAAAVSAFFEEEALSIDRLRENAMIQTDYLIKGFDQLGFEIISPIDRNDRGGFVSLKVNHADVWVNALRDQGIYTDARGQALRFGPAPYLLQSDFDRVLEVMKDLKAKA
jgi:kynureninase